MMQLLDWAGLDEKTRTAALARPALAEDAARRAAVAEILTKVRREGDAALREYTRRFDGVEPAALRVPEGELARAEAALPAALDEALRTAAANIEAFHAAQRPRALRVEPAPGLVCERLARPLETVGLYVPAGSAPLPSTVLMLAIPARLAGCPRRVLCTPPRADGRADPVVLAAARLCGVTDLFLVGGAQAVAAMAYGTESLPRADKIFGPGNAWVTEAKRQVAQDPAGAAVDLPAGPSELLVIADAAADPAFVAADLLSQAEHGPDSQVLLLTPDAGLAASVRRELEAQLAALPRAAVAREALAKSRVILVADLAQAFELANRYAPEHLILQLERPRAWLDAVRNAGSVFLGPWTPESLGDYCSGTNHVLPTYGYARNTSGLGLEAFMKTLTVQEADRGALRALGPVAVRLAECEGLEAHARAVRCRLGEEAPDVRRA